MDNAHTVQSYQLGDQTTSDITVHLRNQHGKSQHVLCHSSILKTKSKFFANQLSTFQSNKCIEVSCPASDYDHYIRLLNLLYISEDTLLDSLESVKSTLGLLQASISLCCNSITSICIQYLEAMPWEEKEEETILKIIPTLGSDASPLVARFHSADINATKNVFISAIHFATSIEKSFPPLSDEIKLSAQEQIDYMLAEDKETPWVVIDEEVRSEARAGLAKIFSAFKIELDSLTSDFDQRVLQCVSDLDWICNVLSKMELMTDFVSGLACISDYVLEIVQDEKYNSCLWSVKLKLVELVGKALEAIGFGNVVLPTASRIKFLKTWLPYLRMMKPVLDSKCKEDEGFMHKMDADLCQNIEGAIVSLVLALPSSEQADILMDWMKRTEELGFPDLTEAFEIWCYRTKAAKRRLVLGFNESFKNEISN
ncbi:uncharacterized protein A4U43_C04F34150 [Asparagus officinalis]|uniref:BTB domain-containing protein n=1 Tax=Asparagus officinalis TaxID=4686 RepID=A0A5P1FA84_ASPOF|nr:BTB/POZ domain-containing protein At3g05675-like [Asparagus officinalis]XP_020263648.1 BTB/POZ domain-containing protein At3g05675-like [Asparagus officinalis]XP_020263649.1 BTB/POZ domain-containing protein At3g05675-like [Asparagus officinalis]XP_020263650.1 BTB/POZ domain-containing protein At3g05675-like [Asparagus officinalis]XP_020263651.1 BTB/POZ domain-containing protein At3g05675-like [Asparagus officinalis]ONK73679.1 uncharacterized protein A4U43_C04F34150 [Asparagus officinalis]